MIPIPLHRCYRYNMSMAMQDQLHIFFFYFSFHTLRMSVPCTHGHGTAPSK